MSSVLTVIDYAESYDLTTLETVKEEFGISANDQSQDDKLSRMIQQASSVIASECDRVFGLETVREVFHHHGGESIVLSRRPIVEIESITIDNSDTPMDEDEYEVDLEAGIVYRLTSGDSYCLTAWPSNISVVYSGGYLLLDSLPPALERACISLVKMYTSSTTRDPVLKSESIPGVLERTWWVGESSLSDDGSLPPNIQGLIDPFRNLGV